MRAFVPPVAVLIDIIPLKRQVPHCFINEQTVPDSNDSKTQEWIERVKNFFANRQMLQTDFSGQLS